MDGNLENNPGDELQKHDIIQFMEAIRQGVRQIEREQLARRIKHGKLRTNAKSNNNINRSPAAMVYSHCCYQNTKRS